MLTFLNKYPLTSHVLFWVGVFLLDMVSRDISFKFYSNGVFAICKVIPQIIASYLTVYYLVPKFFLKKRYIEFAIWFALSAYIISAFARFLIVYAAEPILYAPDPNKETILEIFMEIKWIVLAYFPATYIMVFFFWLLMYLNLSRKNIELQNEKTSAELKILKAQLNPHFLFNTLNNIYSLSLDNSSKTSESIGKLSEILDYVLYRCDSKFVPLSDEIKLLDNYIALEKLRYDDRLQITFEKEIDYDNEIAPLILLSLVENAFKHGAGEDGGSPEINILVQSKNNTFTFLISNSVASANEENPNPSIGLKNIRKQLELIYGNNYELEIDEKSNSFTVKLEIKN